jgi:hypothetical protein
MGGLLCFSETYVHGVRRCLARFWRVLLPNLLPHLIPDVCQNSRRSQTRSKSLGAKKRYEYPVWQGKYTPCTRRCLPLPSAEVPAALILENYTTDQVCGTRTLARNSFRSAWNRMLSTSKIAELLDWLPSHHKVSPCLKVLRKPLSSTIDVGNGFSTI